MAVPSTPNPILPVIDLSPLEGGNEADAQQVAQQIDLACCESGFFLITGHGVPRTVIDTWFDISRGFFEAPNELKARSAPDANSLHNGYHGMSVSTLAQGEGEASPPDLREYFMVGRLDLSDPYFRSEDAGRFYHRNIWPEFPGAFRATAETYYRAVESLGAQLMRLFAQALGLAPTYFDDKIDRHFAVLSSIFYPVPKIPPQPGQLRAGAHTDYGSLTILAPTDAPGGLQIKVKGGDWIDVPYVPDAFVINIGDMMARWTNDRWVSTMHRVVNPPSGSGPVKPRQSVAYFLHPNYDTVIECLPGCASDQVPSRYEPILAGDYMLAKEAKINEAAPQ
jgi:isopenicillin N synthase-like dioxygenase